MTRSIPALVRLLGASGVAVPLLALGLPALVGCGVEDGASTSGNSGSGSTSPAGGGGASGEGGSGTGAGTSDGDDVLEGPCPLGSSRECKVTNELGCLEGRQYCVDGVWSDCERHVGRSTKHRALTDDAETCGASPDTTANTCDAGCQAIAPTEVPNFGEGSSSFVDWVVGSLGDVPADALQEGLIEPCNSDRDCEFDHYCNLGTGQCIPFAPGQTNPACADTWDVSVPVPCGGDVIICNRGGQPIPEATIESEFEIQYRAPGNPIANNTYWMDGCALGGVDGTCPVDIDGDIPPGECVPVPCDVPVGYTVFLDGGPGNSEECECGNNWTMNPGGECGEPACGGDVGTAGEVPVTMLIAMDNSGSMNDGNPSRLTVVKNAMRSFVQDAGSAGLGVAMRFWPGNTWTNQSARCDDNTCDGVGPFVAQNSCAKHPCDFWTGTTTGASVTLDQACSPEVQSFCNVAANRRCCDQGSGTPKRWDQNCAKAFDAFTGGACSACNHPNVPKPTNAATSTYPDGPQGFRYVLTSDAAPADTAEATLVAAINGLDTTSLGTPMYPALEGAVDYCRQYQAAVPGERCVVVFATDGDPSGCNTSANSIRALASAGAADDVLTYVIGIEGSNETFMNNLASSGGTGAAYILGGGAAAEENFRQALESIRNTFGCSYTIPADTDPSLVSVQWNQGAGETPLTEVSDVTGCGAGVESYYFASATELVLCPQTCEAVRAEDTSTIELVIACDNAAVPVTYTAEFTAEGQCDEIGTFPKWTLLLYNAEVPTGSSIEVRAATKLYADDDDYRTEVDVLSITDANETSDMDDPTRLDTPLGNDAFGEVLRLEFESTVGGGAPDLLDYEVQFTCAPTE